MSNTSGLCSISPPSGICLEVRVESLVSRSFHFELTSKLVLYTLFKVTLFKTLNSMICAMGNNFSVSRDKRLDWAQVSSSSRNIAAVVLVGMILSLSQHDDLLIGQALGQQGDVHIEVIILS